MQTSRCVIGWALETYQPYICLVEGCSVGCTVVDGLHVPGREHVLSHRSWNRGSQQRSFLAGCPQCSAVPCGASQMSGRFGRFDSRRLKQEPTMIWWWRWWMRWASTTNDSQKEMKQGQRKWSYVVWDFRLLTSTSTSDQRPATQ
jgi:hypothetical protein